MKIAAHTCVLNPSYHSPYHLNKTFQVSPPNSNKLIINSNLYYSPNGPRIIRRIKILLSPSKTHDMLIPCDVEKATMQIFFLIFAESRRHDIDGRRSSSETWSLLETRRVESMCSRFISTAIAALGNGALELHPGNTNDFEHDSSPSWLPVLLAFAFEQTNLI